MVILPKQLVVYMVQDLVQADSDRVELGIVTEQMNLQNEFINKQNEILEVFANKNDRLNEAYMLCSDDRNDKELQLRDAINKARRIRGQRNIAILSCIAMAGLIVLANYTKLD